MKLSSLTPAQEFILKTLKFDSDLSIKVTNKVPKVYKGKYVLFNVNKLSFENLVFLRLLVEVGDSWYLNRL